MQKYLGYAIGETLLVFVGILFTLGINTREQEKAADQELQSILRTIKVKFIEVLKEVKTTIDYFESDKYLNRLSFHEMLLQYNYLNSIEKYRQDATSILELLESEGYETIP
ncbi:hypothetical protein [Psychroserpens sp.]|uniref:hypothetical protein n=1 Tax=Psychroserpens sp. TaxID=2020870 RepID=UPI0039E49508